MSATEGHCCSAGVSWVFFQSVEATVREVNDSHPKTRRVVTPTILCNAYVLKAVKCIAASEWTCPSDCLPASEWIRQDRQSWNAMQGCTPYPVII